MPISPYSALQRSAFFLLPPIADLSAASPTNHAWMHSRSRLDQDGRWRLRMALFRQSGMISTGGPLHLSGDTSDLQLTMCITIDSLASYS